MGSSDLNSLLSANSNSDKDRSVEGSWIGRLFEKIVANLSSVEAARLRSFASSDAILRVREVLLNGLDPHRGRLGRERRHRAMRRFFPAPLLCFSLLSAMGAQALANKGAIRGAYDPHWACASRPESVALFGAVGAVPTINREHTPRLSAKLRYKRC